jgi:hypothetical protein
MSVSQKSFLRVVEIWLPLSNLAIRSTLFTFDEILSHKPNFEPLEVFFFY